MLNEISLPWANAGDLKDRSAIRPNCVDLFAFVHIVVAWAEYRRLLAGGASAESYGYSAGNDRYALILGMGMRELIEISLVLHDFHVRGVPVFANDLN